MLGCLSSVRFTNVTHSWTFEADERRLNMLTDNLKEANLAHHRVRVQLAHVISPIVLLHVIDVKQPSLLIVVSHREPWDLHDYVLMDRQQHLTAHVDPRHLENYTYRWRIRDESQESIEFYLIKR